jgi:hypothetical protein
MNYSSFEPLPKNEEEIQIKIKKPNKYYETKGDVEINIFIEQNKLVRLNSIYSNTIYSNTSYYYNLKNGQLYRLYSSNINKLNYPNFEIINDPEIIKYNNLLINDLLIEKNSKGVKLFGDFLET